MSKVTMPEPTVWIKTRKSNGEVDLSMEGPIKHVDLFDWQPCITTTQAEAYTDARVREALKAAKELADWAEHEVGVDPELTPGLQAIRALIPK